MKKRATKLMSFLMASAMAVTSPYAAGVSAAAVYAVGQEKQKWQILERGVKSPQVLLCRHP